MSHDVPAKKSDSFWLLLIVERKKSYFKHLCPINTRRINVPIKLSNISTLLFAKIVHCKFQRENFDPKFLAQIISTQKDGSIELLFHIFRTFRLETKCILNTDNRKQGERLLEDSIMSIFKYKNKEKPVQRPQRQILRIITVEGRPTENDASSGETNQLYWSTNNRYIKSQ